MQNQIPNNWQKVKLGKYAGVLGGFAFNSKSLNGQGVGTPVIKIQNLLENGNVDVNNTEYADLEKISRNLKKFELLDGDFVVAMTGATSGKVAMLKSDGKPLYLNQRVGKFFIKNEKKLYKKFLYYSVVSPKNKYLLLRLADGSAQGNMSSTQIEEMLELCIPGNIEDQKKIVHILSAFDDKIELNNKIAKTLEEMAQAIFKEWFIKNSKFENQKLNTFVDIISGHPFSSKLYINSKHNFGVVTIKNVQDGNFVTECDSFIKELDIPNNMNLECILRSGDILLSLTGNVGRVCFVYGGKYLLNQRVAKLKPRNRQDSAFCYFLFRQPSLQNQLINMAKGSAQPNLSPVETGEMELPLPSRDILDKFTKLVNPIYEKLINTKLENQKLAQMRDLLLPKLMKGEIRV